MRSQDGFQKQLLEQTKKSGYQFYVVTKIMDGIKYDFNIVRV